MRDFHCQPIAIGDEVHTKLHADDPILSALKAFSGVIEKSIMRGRACIVVNEAGERRRMVCGAAVRGRRPEAEQAAVDRALREF